MPGRDEDWEEAVAGATPADCVPVAATDPLYILYTSGTTGQPKGVIRDNGGHMVALHWSMKNIYGVEPGEAYWAASDVGWVVGHSYIVYAPLLHGNTTILFEGKPVGTPDAGVFWRIISEHNVKVLFTAPTAFRAIKQQDPEGDLIGNYDLSGLRYLFLAGERADPDTIQWAARQLNVPVIDHWWQTETGWSICANPAGIELLPVKLGSPTLPMPGWDMRVLDEKQQQVAPGEVGALVAKLPLPPSCLPNLWNAEARFLESYLEEYPGHYKTGDAGFIDEDGYVFVMTRTDDVINVAGHRLSTGGMEEVLADHPDVAECAVIGVADAMKGQIPFGFLVLNAGVAREAGEIVGEVVAWCASASARWRRSSPPSSSRACPRRARARSCAARCRRSPTTNPGKCRRRSTTRRSSTRSPRRCNRRDTRRGRRPGAPRAAYARSPPGRSLTSEAMPKSIAGFGGCSGAGSAFSFSFWSLARPISTAAL